MQGHFETAGEGTPFSPPSALGTDTSTSLAAYSCQAALQWDKANFCTSPRTSVSEEKAGLSVIAFFYQVNVGNKAKNERNGQFTRDLEEDLGVIDADKDKSKSKAFIHARGFAANIAWAFKGVVESACHKEEKQSIIVTLYVHIYHKLIQTDVKTWDERNKAKHPHFPFYILHVCDQIMIRLAHFANSTKNILTWEKKDFQNLDPKCLHGTIACIEDCVQMGKPFPKELILQRLKRQREEAIGGMQAGRKSQ